MRRLINMLSGNSVKLNDSAFGEAVRATEALIKFCEEHDGLSVPQLRAFLTALHADDKQAARRAFKSIGFGAMGSFPDWIPPVKFANETPDYVCVVFEALTVKWYNAASDVLR